MSEIAIALHQHWFFDEEENAYSTLLTKPEDSFDQDLKEQKKTQLHSALKVAVQHRNVVMVKKIIEFVRSADPDNLKEIINLRLHQGQSPNVVEAFADSLSCGGDGKVTPVDLQIIALLGKAGANFFDGSRGQLFVPTFLNHVEQGQMANAATYITEVMAEAVVNSGLDVRTPSPLDVAAQGFFAKIRAVSESHRKKVVAAPEATSEEKTEAKEDHELVFDLSFLKQASASIAEAEDAGSHQYHRHGV